MAERKADIRRLMRDRPRPGHRRRALGAAGRPGAPPRAQAVHGPPRRSAAASGRTCSPRACASSSRRAWSAAATLPPPAASKIYELTEWGAELAPVLVALGRWGSRAPLPDQPPPLGIDAAVVALETTFDAEAAGWVDAVYELDPRRSGLHARGGRRAPGGHPRSRARRRYAGRVDRDGHGHAGRRRLARPPDRARGQRGRLAAIEGDPEAAADFVGLFAPPVPVGGPTGAAKARAPRARPRAG